jgi:hypothetical protein
MAQCTTRSGVDGQYQVAGTLYYLQFPDLGSDSACKSRYGTTATRSKDSQGWSCKKSSWDTTKQSSCCSAPSNAMSVTDCDPNWCLFSDQCVDATADWCADQNRLAEVGGTCAANGAWAQANPVAWANAMTKWCSASNANLKNAQCLQFIVNPPQNINTDAILIDNVVRQWSQATTDGAKQDVINDTTTACWMDYAQPGFYSNLYKSASALVPGLSGLPIDPVCIHPVCASSQFKSQAARAVEGSKRCPAVQQCIAVNQISNEGTVRDMTLNNTNNCSFSASMIILPLKRA